MDYSDISARIDRINRVIHFDARDGELVYTRFAKVSPIKWTLTTDQAELLVRLQAIISEMAALKDNLINFLDGRNEDGRSLVNAFIDKTQALQLIIDLNNHYKHGPYPLKHEKSGQQPRLEKLSASGGFQAQSVPRGSAERKVTMNLITGKVTKEGLGIKTVITGMVVGANNQFICSLNDLIEGAMSAIENFVKNTGISSK